MADCDWTNKKDRRHDRRIKRFRVCAEYHLSQINGALRNRDREYKICKDRRPPITKYTEPEPLERKANRNRHNDSKADASERWQGPPLERHVHREVGEDHNPRLAEIPNPVDLEDERERDRKQIVEGRSC